MKKAQTIAWLTAFIVTAFVATILFVGFEYKIGDHESGSRYEPFLKASPTLKLKFFDPFQGGDAGGNPERLSTYERVQFADYCRYKMGLDGDERACFAAYQAVACNMEYVSRGIDCPPDSKFARSRSQATKN